MKKIISFVLCLCFIFCMTGCEHLEELKKVKELSDLAEKLCEEYNASTDKLIEGELRFASINTEKISFEYNVAVPIDEEGMKLVEKETKTIRKLIYIAVNEVYPYNRPGIVIATNYEYAEGYKG